MKVFVITDNLMKGGKERRLLELLRSFDKEENIEIKLVILRDKIEYPEIFELKHTELIVLKRRIKKDLFVFVQIWNLIKSFKPDVIHSWGSMPSIYTFLIAFILRVPFINAMITNSKCKKYSSEWLRAKITFPFSDIVLSNSKAGLIAYKAPIKKARVIYNGFNMDRITNLENAKNIRQRYSISTKYVVGMVAAFHPRKDYETFLEVAHEISSHNSDVTFLAIGDGKKLEYYQQKYKDNNRIIFTGNSNKVESLINIFDIGVLLTNSNNHLEGISNSIIEYMALGKSVIATRGGGTDELISHMKNGVLIDSLSKSQFKNAISELLDSIELREQLSKRANQQIKDQFSIESMSNKTLKLYQEILKAN